MNLSEDEREDALEEFIKEHKDEYKMNHEKNMRAMLDRYCEMSEEDREEFLAENE